MIANSNPRRASVNVGAVLLLSLVLSACQMPSYSPPSGSSAPSGSSGGASGGGMPSSSGGSNGGSTGAGMPSSGGSQEGSNGGSNGGIPSPSGSDGGAAADPSGGSSGQSLEDLDQALEDSLEGFDESVGSQGSTGAEIDILSPSGGGGGMQVDSDTPLFEEASDGPLADGTIAEGNAEIESRAAEGPESEASESENGSIGAATEGSEDMDIAPIPDDIGDGQGDDIVLRQIRDAAMKESDPLLREKLWDEYRRIKNQ
ncbi:MAG: hypothetical protein QF884_05695 [Porticoccaceae bacterium]|nr:hypothetical protein [Porticoccaceae bacterium]